jgi:hypothetical protein
LQIKTKIVTCHTADSKPVKQEVNCTVILPPLVFPALAFTDCLHWQHLLAKPSVTVPCDCTRLGNLGRNDGHGKFVQRDIALDYARDITLNIANVNLALALGLLEAY